MTRLARFFLAAATCLVAWGFLLSKSMWSAIGLTILVTLALIRLMLGVHPKIEIQLESFDNQITVGTPFQTSLNIQLKSQTIFTKTIRVLAYPLPEISVQLSRKSPFQELKLQVPTQVRGIITVSRVKAIHRDPWRVFSKQVTDCSGFQVAIVPRVGTILGLDLGNIEHGTDPINSLAGNDEIEKIREYVFGDDARYIHWRNSARNGRLMVREMASPPSEDIVSVIIDNRPTGHGNQVLSDSETFETALEKVAALLQLLEQNRISYKLTSASGRDLLKFGPPPLMKNGLRALAELEVEFCSNEVFSRTINSQTHATMVVSRANGHILFTFRPKFSMSNLALTSTYI